jgi:hypothetical protein
MLRRRRARARGTSRQPLAFPPWLTYLAVALKTLAMGRARKTDRSYLDVRSVGSDVGDRQTDAAGVLGD